jgi:hypothetical protein
VGEALGLVNLRLLHVYLTYALVAGASSEPGDVSVYAVFRSRLIISIRILRFLLQPLVLRLGFFQNGGVGVGVFVLTRIDVNPTEAVNPGRRFPGYPRHEPSKVSRLERGRSNHLSFVRAGCPED